MNVEKIRETFQTELSGVDSAESLERLRVAFLGKKGVVTTLRKNVDFKSMSADEKRQFGEVFNSLKKFVENQIAQKKSALRDLSSTHMEVDLTLPGNRRNLGMLHPITLIQAELEQIFQGMGFLVDEGFEVETEFSNFDSLNIPADHPAREMQDTFWLTNGKLLRTHTSSNQVRILRRYGAPVRAIFPGRCFRYESVDASHENTFFQCEGLLVDKNISIANLIAIMKVLLGEVFHREVQVRLRPGFFPFVEPGFELDIRCLFCNGEGCSTCKQSGWVELLPCGLVHPRVLEHGNLDPKEYSGFAFGLGMTRLAMMKFGIPEIRLFNAGDLRINRQFPATI